jgi:protein-arginine kinase activator protein McsA
MADGGPKSDTCPQCGRSWKRIRHEYRAGCAYCYTWFHQEIGELLGRPATTYVGQDSGQIQNKLSYEKKVSLLQKKIEDAVPGRSSRRPKFFRKN